jgi:putative transposase
MIVKRAFKFRIHPTQEPLQKFQQFSGARRWIYNLGLEQRQRAYAEKEQTLSDFEQNNALVQLKEKLDQIRYCLLSTTLMVYFLG